MKDNFSLHPSGREKSITIHSENVADNIAVHRIIQKRYPYSRNGGNKEHGDHNDIILTRVSKRKQIPIATDLISLVVFILYLLKIFYVVLNWRKLILRTFKT